MNTHTDSTGAKAAPSGSCTDIRESGETCPECGHRPTYRQTFFPTCTFELKAYDVWECTWCNVVCKAVPATDRTPRLPTPREDS